MKENLQKFWKPNNKNALCWAFYYVNDNKDVLLEIFHIISCILSYNNSILILNPKTQARKCLVLCKIANGIITL
jgi:hypothetical protein